MRRSCQCRLSCPCADLVSDVVAAESPESGSARKRARLSSPTYEEHFPITQEDVETFDELERQLSQSVPVVPPHSRSLPSETEASGMPATNRRSIGLEKTETGAMDEGACIQSLQLCEMFRTCCCACSMAVVAYQAIDYTRSRRRRQLF